MGGGRLVEQSAAGGPEVPGGNGVDYFIRTSDFVLWNAPAFSV
jgi:hypothetical protein